jgi:cytoskeletal protein CcmA (bactofilin family)
MANDHHGESAAREASSTVSVVGPGMEVTGEIKCDGTVRIEGRVEGSIEATKSVVIGRDGTVDGDITTRDIVVAGSVAGTITGQTRVELQDTCKVEGNVHGPRIKLDEGGQVDGRLHMGHMGGGSRSTTPPKDGASGAAEGGSSSTGSRSS